MDDVAARLKACDRVLKPQTRRGIHAHHNPSLGVANCIAAMQNGAVRVDAWPMLDHRYSCAETSIGYV